MAKIKPKTHAAISFTVSREDEMLFFTQKDCAPFTMHAPAPKRAMDLLEAIKAKKVRVI